MAWPPTTDPWMLPVSGAFSWLMLALVAVNAGISWLTPVVMRFSTCSCKSCFKARGGTVDYLDDAVIGCSSHRAPKLARPGRTEGRARPRAGTTNVSGHAAEREGGRAEFRMLPAEPPKWERTRCRAVSARVGSGDEEEGACSDRSLRLSDA
jgi:hypothetical protein